MRVAALAKSADLAKSIVAIEKPYSFMPKTAGNPAAPAFIEPRQTCREPTFPKTSASGRRA